jgi:heterodisulfide reductase subunit A
MGEAAAQRALRILSTERLAAGGIVAEVRHSICSLCERCIAACPYGARCYDEDEEKIMVDELMCQGCGTCAAVCPNSASVLRGYKDQQMFEVIDSALEQIF